MYSDGMLGNRAIYDGLAPMTTAVFNYMRPENAAAYKQAQLFPWINEYWENPDLDVSKKDQVSNSLIAYMSQAKGFKAARFKS